MDIVLPPELMATMEEAIDPIGAKQDLRSAVGAKLGLDIGKPNELKKLDGVQEPVQVRDALGMLLDTQHYAKRSCNECQGRGVIVLIKHVPDAEAKRFIKDKPESEAFLFQREPGKWYTRESVTCGCVKRRYEKQYEAFAKALVKAGLAKHNVAQKRYELV